MADTDLDIIEIDNKIRQSFDNEVKNLQHYKEKLEDLKKTLNSSYLYPHKRNELEKTIFELKQTIEKIENSEQLNFYTIETTELLEKYHQILKTPVKLSFCGKSRQNNREKSEIIQKYIEIARKYYQINIKPTDKKFRLYCDSCSNKQDFATEENAYICLECGAQQEVLQHTTSYKDSDRVNIATKYTYDRKVHFRDCINQYQGKQNCTIDQKIYDQIEDILERHHLLIGDKNTKREVRFANITKEHILMFLKELGFSKHYENVTLIHYNITGKKPDDISYLEDKLLADFDLLVETYDKHFKNKMERVNFISTQYVLYQLLLKHKHPCKKEDFVILKTMDRKNFHNNLTRDIFGYLGWNFQPVQ